MLQAKADSLPPVAYWKFDEGSGTVASDSSGNGNAGTLVNGPQWVSGVVGNALKFDGIDDYVRISHSSSLDIVGNEISVEFWMKLTNGWHPDPSASYIYDQILYDKGDAYVSTMIKSTGALRFNIPYVPPYPETNKNNWNADTWYHIAEVFNGTQIRIYVNGVLDRAEAVVGSVSRSTIDLAIGSHCSGGKHFFNGVIDEFAIYSYARTAEEIWNDYVSVKRALIVNAKWQDVPSAYYPTVATALEELGVSYDILNPETLNLDILRNYDFVFIPSLGPYIPPEDLAIYNPDVFADMVEQYVIDGGALLFCPGHSIVYGQEVREPPIFDIAYGGGNYRIVDFQVTDDTHPIMQGPYHTFSLNERIYAHEMDLMSYPDCAQPLGVYVDRDSGAVLGEGIMVFSRGCGIAVAAGQQIGWTSSEPAIYNGVPAEEWIKLTKNIITWLLTWENLYVCASIDIKPDTLNLGSKGRWITSYIELLEGLDLNNINVSSILLNDTIPVASSTPATIDDYDNDGIPDLMVKFDRAKVIQYILAHVNRAELIEGRSITITLTITGKFEDGTTFKGNDTIRMVKNVKYPVLLI